MQATHLKHLKNGRVFLYTEALSKSGHMMPCDVNGNIIGGFSDAAPAAQKRQPTPYLGNPANGRLLDYTEALAARPDLVSISSVEQWDSYLKQEESKSVAQDIQADGLLMKPDYNPIDILKAATVDAREDAAENSAQTSAEVADVIQTVDVADEPLPDILKLSSHDAKQALTAWSGKRGLRLPTTWTVNKMHSACLDFLENKAAA